MTVRISLFVSMALMLMFCINPTQAAVKGGCIPGTYLIQEGSGTQSLWTFSRDGTVQLASSAQGPLNFSDGHGAWKQSKSREAKATLIDFTYDETPPPAVVARVDAVLSFSNKCATVQGGFELRFFDPQTEDPLDLNTDTGGPISETITGRRVTVKK